MASLRILMTGAAGDIGQATTELLRRRGHQVVGLDLRPGHDIVTADLRDAKATAAAVAEAVARLGGLDVLVNNAGVASLQDSALAASEDTRKVIEINLFGSWNATTAAIPALLQSRGRIVNIASLLAHVDLPLLAGYCASKRALCALSDVMRVEYAGQLSVVTVYPGYVKTALHDVARREGLCLDGVLPQESLAAAAAAIAGACIGRPRRTVTVSWSGAATLLLARLLPGVVDALVLRRLARAAAAGTFAGAEVAAAFVSRVTVDHKSLESR